MTIPLNISGVKYEPDDATKKYATKKLGRLLRYLPKDIRKDTRADVILRQIDQPYGNKYQVEVNLHIPGEVFPAKDSTVNILAAIDIVEAKLAAQLHRRKAENDPRTGRRKILRHFRRHN